MENIQLYMEFGEVLDQLQMTVVEKIYSPLYKQLGKFETRMSMLTSGERKVLATIHYSGVICVGDIKKRTGISNISKILSSLEAAGYIKRFISPTNKRYIMIDLTDSGWNVIEEHNKVIPDALMKILSDKIEEDKIHSMIERIKILTEEIASLRNDTCDDSTDN